VVLPAEVVDQLFAAVQATPGYQLTVDLEQQVVRTPEGAEHRFDVEPFRKHCLLNGLDDIGLTLQHAKEIEAYQAKRLADKPWLKKELSA